jgi:phosphoglycolate phosphatase
MPTHVVWDWNGTLLDDVYACVGAINRMLTARQLPCIDSVQYRDVFDFPVKTYYRRLGFDLETEDWDAMAREFHRHYDEFAVKAGLREGAPETLNTIRKRGIAMSVLSACEIGTLERMLEERGIRHFFDHVFGLDNINATSKLDQGKLLVDALDLPPAEILLVGDTNHDHEVAEDLGIRCVLLTGGHQSKARLAANDILETPLDLLSHHALATPLSMRHNDEK